MKLTGRNEIVLCPRALMDIVQKYLNDQTIGTDKITVNGVTFVPDGGTTLSHFQITTDSEVT